MHQIRLQLGLRPKPRWGSSQRSPRPSSWILGGTTSKGKRGKGEQGKREEGKKCGKKGETKGGKEEERKTSPP